MNKLTPYAALLLVLLCLSVIGSNLAIAQVTVGVQAGNTFKYRMAVFWSSSDPNATEPPTELYIYNHTDYYQMNILQVAGTTVDIQTFTYYTNGEEMNNTSSSVVGDPGDSLSPYAANLNVGDSLFPGNTSLPWVVNETVSRFYGTIARDTNHVSVTRNDLSDYAYSSMDLYFDKATGMAVEIVNTNVPSATPEQTISTLIRLIDTNVWSIPAGDTSSPSFSATPTTNPTGASSSPGNQGSQNPIDPIIIVIIAVVVVVPIGAFIVLRKPKPKKEKAAAPTVTKKTSTTEQTSEPKPETSKPAASSTPANLVCGKCGKENPAGSEFCNKCGADLQD
jgi:ribosomal protein L40E